MTQHQMNKLSDVKIFAAEILFPFKIHNDTRNYFARHYPCIISNYTVGRENILTFSNCRSIQFLLSLPVNINFNAEGHQS